MRRNAALILLSAVVAVLAAVRPVAQTHHRYLYVAEPGIRNYVEYGGVGVLVYDIDAGYKFVRRIPSQDVPDGAEPENVKGIAASAATGRLYVTTIRRLMAFDLTTDKQALGQGHAGRLPIAWRSRPTAGLLYVPSFEGPHWTVVDAATGDVRAAIVTQLRRAQHDLRPGRQARLPRRPEVADAAVADPATHTVVQRDRPVRQRHPPVHDQRRADARASSTSTTCSASRSAI